MHPKRPLPYKQPAEKYYPQAGAESLSWQVPSPTANRRNGRRESTSRPHKELRKLCFCSPLPPSAASLRLPSVRKYSLPLPPDCSPPVCCRSTGKTGCPKFNGTEKTLSKPKIRSLKTCSNKVFSGNRRPTALSSRTTDSNTLSRYKTFLVINNSTKRRDIHHRPNTAIQTATLPRSNNRFFRTATPTEIGIRQHNKGNLCHQICSHHRTWFCLPTCKTVPTIRKTHSNYRRGLTPQVVETSIRQGMFVNYFYRSPELE